MLSGTAGSGGLLSGLLGGLPKFANGTNSAPGGLALVGERGPEVLNIPRGGKVIPNDILCRSANKGTSVVYNIDASGADQAAIARLERTLNAHSRLIVAQRESAISSQRMQLTGVS